MRNTELEQKIINLIPSTTVKKEIERQNHKFSDLELVQIIIEFAPTWNQMVEYLMNIKNNMDDIKITEYIDEYISVEKKQYEMLVSNNTDYVYEVDMFPGSPGDKYLCPNYESTYITIKTYEEAYKEFIDVRANNNIIITKCRVAVRNSVEDIDEKDNPVHAILNSNKEIIRIYSNLDAPILDVEMNAIKYPDIFKTGDFVYVDTKMFPQFELTFGNYYNEYDKNKRFGINSFNNQKDFNGVVDECCFLDLSSEYVEYRKIEINKSGYCDYLMCHMHLDFGYLEKVDIENLNSKIKEDYEYALKTLKELECLK